MSDLETDAQSLLKWMMLEGRGLVLGPADQATIALWSIKTLMMVQCTQPKAVSGGLLPEHYRYVYDHREPPPEFRLSLGTRRHEGQWPYRITTLGFEASRGGRPLPLPDGADFNGYRAAFCIGHLVVHAFGQFFEDGSLLNLPGSLQRAFIDVWPTTTRVTYPPPAVLSMATYDSMFV